MATQAIDWHPVILALKSILENEVPQVNGHDIYYDVGKLDLTADYLPACTLWLGSSTFDTARLGKEGGRLGYREAKQFFLFLASYKAGREAEDSFWSNAHAQLEDFLRLILNAVTADTTIAGNVMQSRLVEIIKNPPESPEDENFQAARIEILVTKSWFADA